MEIGVEIGVEIAAEGAVKAVVKNYLPYLHSNTGIKLSRYHTGMQKLRKP